MGVDLVRCKAPFVLCLGINSIIRVRFFSRSILCCVLRPIFGRFLLESYKDIRVQWGVCPEYRVIPEPADQCLPRAAAVILLVGGNLVRSIQHIAFIPVIHFHNFLLWLAGLQGVDPRQLLFGILQLQLLLLHLQPLALQRNLRQGGVKAHKKVALFHGVSLLHQNLRDLLGVRQEHRLDIVRGDGAVALPGVAPVFRHAHIDKGIDLHRVGFHIGKVIPDAQPQSHSPGANGRNQNGNFFLFSHRCRLPPGFSARHPGCGRSHWRIWRCPAHG